MDKKLTTRQRKFAELMASGKYAPAEAAGLAGYSLKSAVTIGTRLMKNAKIQRMLEAAKPSYKKPEKQDSPPAAHVIQPLASSYTKDPLLFFERLMNNDNEDPRLRLDAAKALAPYRAARMAAKSKTEEKAEKARKITSKFAAVAPPPPKLRNAK